MRTNLTSGTSPGASSSVATASIAPGANRLVLAFVANVRGVGLANAPAVSGNGLAWVQVASILVPGFADHRLTCLRALGAAPAAGPLTFDFGGQSQAICAWSVFEYDSVDTSGANGSGAVPQQQTSSVIGTNLSTLMAPLADAATSVVVGGLFLNLNEAVNAGAGLAQINQAPFASAGNRGVLQTEDRTGGGGTIDWSWPTAANSAAIVLEVKASAAVITPSGPPADTEALARRFEPVLFFHQDEKFFPSDAKRYVEQCALWKAQAPFDVKDSWGGKGAPFDRSPIIDYGKIAAIAGEPGTPLGPASIVDDATEERFFDFKGWKDATGTPQPKVTTSSMNTFSNRAPIDAAYNHPDNQGGNKTLRDSRFWYHAELIDGPRLRRMLATVRAPDLVKVYDSLKNAALLNYYLFYPAHVEPLQPSCTNIEATEFGCFAGEWANLSILLERDTPTADFRPTFIGTSGRLMSAPSIPAGQAADDDDAAKRIVMKVSSFGKAQTIGEHPRVFAANGTHGLYLAPGSFVVSYPNESHPNGCGRFEGIPPPPGPQPETHLADNPLAAQGLLWAKVAAGSSLFGALGAAAGLAWGIVEYAEANHGLNVIGTAPSTPDAASDDVTGDPAAGSVGKVVKPKGLTVPDAGSDVQDWISAQGVAVGARRYDFVVDRTVQTWWPGDLGQGGYLGRWGPRVEFDPFGRRAGMRFPAFWRIFFLALANGKASGAF